MIHAHCHDVVICGGGLVGAAFACVLKNSGLRVALIEPVPVASSDQPSFDQRAIALTYSSREIFERTGVWSSLKSDQVTEILTILVSESGKDRTARLSASDVHREALGWNVSAQALGKHLYDEISGSEHITLYDGVAQQIQITDEAACVETLLGDEVYKLKSKLVVIADGGRSPLLDGLGFIVQKKRYRQHVLVCRLRHRNANQNIALEHFTRHGPIALLPVSKKEYSLVWTHDSDRTESLTKVGNGVFLRELSRELDFRVDGFTRVLSERVIYELRMTWLKRAIKERVVVVGNAAHTVHPVAGQGFNLSLREVADLAEMLTTRSRRGWDIGSYDVLCHFERLRQSESRAVMNFTDGLIQLFGSDRMRASLVRQLAIESASCVPQFRRFLLNRTMGLRSGKWFRDDAEPVSRQV